MEKNLEKKRPSLEAVALHENTKVVTGFMKSFAISFEEAAEIFDQVKKMLWLINEMEFEGLKNENRMFSIDSSLLVIDEMWHTFILFTRDYRKFCFDHFGYFIDHVPTVGTESEVIERFAELSALGEDERNARIMDEKRWQYTYVFQKLGKDCFLKWYQVFHQKYTRFYLAELRMQAIQIKYTNS